MQTSLLLSFVIKLLTQGREGVLRTTTKHIVYRQPRSMFYAWRAILVMEHFKIKNKNNYASCALLMFVCF
jgi:hypothetical protein